jgi:hypothetical protein
MERQSEENSVLNWYGSILSRRVDLVSDYAGSELFIVEFDSLLLKCFSDPKLNFSGKYWKFIPLKPQQSAHTMSRWLSTAPRGLHC